MVACLPRIKSRSEQSEVFSFTWHTPQANPKKEKCSRNWSRENLEKLISQRNRQRHPSHRPLPFIGRTGLQCLRSCQQKMELPPLPKSCSWGNWRNMRTRDLIPSGCFPLRKARVCRKDFPPDRKRKPSILSLLGPSSGNRL